MKKVLAVLLFGVLAVVVIGILIQFVPYGRNHTNPPVVNEPQWDSPETKAIAQRACYDCHSNETNWDLWYIDIAPAAWLIQHDVDEGRRHMNFSEWGSGHNDVDDAREMIFSGEMPPRPYLMMHPEARLTDAEKNQLADGIENLPGGDGDDD